MMLKTVGLIAAIASAGCVNPIVGRDTGLIGVVVRGPIQPVCMANEPCDDAPFSAGFTVRQNDRVVARFRSDAEGRFEIRLAPGSYTIVPDSDAPLMQPSAQTKEVVVGAVGLTTVRLDFDTGIR